MALFRRKPPPTPSLLNRLWSSLPGYLQLVLVLVAAWTAWRAYSELIKRYRAKKGASRALEERRKAGIPDSDQRPFRIARAAAMDAARQHAGQDTANSSDQAPFAPFRPRVGSYSAYGAPSTSPYLRRPSITSSSFRRSTTTGHLASQLPRSSSSASSLNRFASINAARERSRTAREASSASALGQGASHTAEGTTKTGRKLVTVRRVSGGRSGSEPATSKDGKVSQWRASLEPQLSSQDPPPPPLAQKRTTLKRSAPSYPDSLASFSAADPAASSHGDQDDTASSRSRGRATKKARAGSVTAGSTPILEEEPEPQNGGGGPRTSLPGSLDNSIVIHSPSSSDGEDQREAARVVRMDLDDVGRQIQRRITSRTATGKGKKREIEDVDRDAESVFSDSGARRRDVSQKRSRIKDDYPGHGEVKGTPSKDHGRKRKPHDEEGEADSPGSKRPSPRKSRRPNLPSDEVDDSAREADQQEEEQEGGKTRNAAGERFKIGEDGEKRKLVRIKETRKKYKMPADSEHADRSLEVEDLVEVWVTQAEFEALSAQGRLEGQEAVKQAEPSLPPSATKRRPGQSADTGPSSPRGSPFPRTSSSTSLGSTPNGGGGPASPGRPRNSLGRMRILSSTPRSGSTTPARTASLARTAGGLADRSRSPSPDPAPPVAAPAQAERPMMEGPSLWKGKAKATQDQVDADATKSVSAAGLWGTSSQTSVAASAASPFAFGTVPAHNGANADRTTPSKGEEKSALARGPSLLSRLGPSPAPAPAQPEAPKVSSFGSASTEGSKTKSLFGARSSAFPPAASNASAVPLFGSTGPTSSAAPNPPAFTFGSSPAQSAAPTDSLASASQERPAFSFGSAFGGTSNPAASTQDKTSAAGPGVEGPKAFSFGGAPESTSPFGSTTPTPKHDASSVPSQAPADLFAGKSTFSSQSSESKPAASLFGQPAIAIEAPASKPATSGFSFANPFTSKPVSSVDSDANSSKPASVSTSGNEAPAFSFGSAPREQDQKATETAPASPAFSFGASTPSFSFGAPASSAQPTASSTDAGFGEGDAANAPRGRRVIAGSGRRLLGSALRSGSGARSPSPAPSNPQADEAAAATSGQSSPVPSFSFGEAASTPSPFQAPSAFGQPSSTPSTKSAPPSPASAFSFGNGAASGFGGAAPSDKGSSVFGASVQQSSTGIFGSAATPAASNSAPSFSFGSNTQSAFGQAPSTGSSTTTSFAFGGGSTTTSTPAFGATSTAAPSFSFGAPAATPQTPVTTSAPTFSFTAPSPQPGS